MNPLVAWVKERESIRKKKEAGEASPYSENVIFRTYRFCNAFREDDKVTRWIFNNWLKPNQNDPDVWFAMVVARHLNLPETLAQLGYPVPWNKKRFLSVLAKRKRIGLTSFNSAYRIRPMPGHETPTYLAQRVLGPLWKVRDKIRPVVGDSLDGFHQRLLTQYGLGSFMAAQIVADTKHVEPLKSALDWWEFAASGPGSRQGLNRLLGRPVKQNWKEEDWRNELVKLRERLKPEFEAEGIPWCDAQNTQNQLCETAKFERTRLGEGRPKRKYVVQLLS